MQFLVGLKLDGKTSHMTVDAADALIAALKVKLEQPEAHITYVRRQNRRGDGIRFPMKTRLEKRFLLQGPPPLFQ